MMAPKGKPIMRDHLVLLVPSLEHVLSGCDFTYATKGCSVIGYRWGAATPMASVYLDHVGSRPSNPCSNSVYRRISLGTQKRTRTSSTGPRLGRLKLASSRNAGAGKSSSSSYLYSTVASRRMRLFVRGFLRIMFHVNTSWGPSSGW